MKRDIILELKAWKENKRRKPLLLTGVRQCGKTYILKQFGEEEFSDVLYINFESSSKYAGIFEYDFDVNRIVKELELLQNQKIEPGYTLVIFDEIQECPKAITSLKYFCENMRKLHIVCAGSLLGVALKSENISFPVGKVNRMQMYPMTFKEFVQACGEEQYLELLKGWSVEREIPDVYFDRMKRLLKEYYVIGGMPEVVQEWIESHDFSVVEEVQDEILAGYADDFSKHAPVKEIEKIRMIWDSIPIQLAKENNKFVFSHVKKGKRAHELEAALQWLKNAGLITMLELVSDVQVPLSAYADSTYFKVYMSDVGLLCRRSGFTYETILFDDERFINYKGALTENYVLNELRTQYDNIFFWRSGNTAEVDFVIEDRNKVIPIEVKAADRTQAKSYKQFCKKYHPEIGLKASLKNIAANDCEGTKTFSYPLFLLWDMKTLH